MIRSISGTITSVGENNVVIDVQGVGYLIFTPTLQNTFNVGDKTTLQTYLAVRETALDLYGFPTRAELEMFELILGVPKVRPKSALQTLCLATPNLLIEAAQKNDGLYLHKVSGIGKKTAENITLFLHGKLDKLPTVTNTKNDAISAVQADAIDALITLGYELSTARETILALPTKDATINSLVTRALKQIK